MPPAARISDFHACPIPPHLGGGPVVAGATDVLIGYMPAARLGDAAACATGEDKIVQGEPTVLIANKPAARLGDATKHGGKIAVGCPTVMIGSSAQIDALAAGQPFCEECAAAEAAEREAAEREGA